MFNENFMQIKKLISFEVFILHDFIYTLQLEGENEIMKIYITQMQSERISFIENSVVRFWIGRGALKGAS